MIYLKIFHKQSYVILLLLLSGCLSSLNNGYPNKINIENDSENIFIEPVLNGTDQNKPLEEDFVSEVILVQPDIPIEGVNWMVPEIEELNTEIYLPEVLVKEKIVNISSVDSILVWNYAPNYKFEKEFNTNIEANTENRSENNEIKEVLTSSFIVPKEEKITTYISEKIISSNIMDKIEISLVGRGWIYLPDNENRNIVYNGRHFSGENTIYTFIPKIKGTFVLRFQYQDLSTSIFKIEKITLTIFETKEVTQENNQKIYDISDINNLEYNNKLDFESTVNKMILDNDSKGLAAFVPELLNSNNLEVKNNLTEIADILYNNSYFILSASIFEQLLNDNSLASFSDYYLFLLGNIYENDSSIRNEIQAAKYYKTLTDSYPASIYWEESLNRYRFLKRRYIDIR